MPHTIRLHRVLMAKPEKVYRAFLDPQAMAKWLPPFGFTCQFQHFEPKVGGTFKFTFTNFTTQQSHSSGGKYLELAAGKRIRYSGTFDNPNLPGELLVTIALSEVFCGTQLNIEQAGIPEAIPEAACYLGWQESLVQLAHLVEPEITQ